MTHPDGYDDRTPDEQLADAMRQSVQRMDGQSKEMAEQLASMVGGVTSVIDNRKTETVALMAARILSGFVVTATAVDVDMVDDGDLIAIAEMALKLYNESARAVAREKRGEPIGEGTA